MAASDSLDYRVEFIAHASFRVQSGGKTFLTDPWYVDPIDCNATFHWPPVAHDIGQLARETDAIWISHMHPDHLDARTLSHFPRHVPIYIGEFAKKRFRNRLIGMGFTVHELPFGKPSLIEGTDFIVTILESDYGESAAFDSSIVVQTPQFTIFDNNDCYLKDDKYEWVAANYPVDYAFLGYSPASYFPICFEFDEPEKQNLLRESADRRYGDFLKAARYLQPKISVPFAMGIRFLHPSMLWQNIEFNRPQEAVRRASSAGIRAEMLAPADRINTGGRVERNSPIMTVAQEDAALLSYARSVREQVEDRWNTEPAAREGLIDSFRRYLVRLWTLSRERFPSVAENVIAFIIEGPRGGEFHFDFSKTPEDIFMPGIPARFDMRYTYPDKLLQLRMDDQIDWDEMHFSNRVSVKQHRYASQYYAMLRSQENSREALASATQA